MARYAFVFFTQVIVYTPPGCRISGRGLLTQLHPFCIYIHKKPLPLYDLAPPCGAFQRRPRVWKPFLDITDDDLRNSLDVNVVAAFAFSREVITEFQKLGFEDSNEGGQGGSRKRGTQALLLVSVATSLLARLQPESMGSEPLHKAWQRSLESRIFTFVVLYSISISLLTGYDLATDCTRMS